jgi:hypothetical protein
MKTRLMIGMSAAVFAASAAAAPEIRRETRTENGRKIEYMWIDGVKVHETDPAKQPPPEVVDPGPYDAEEAEAPDDAIILFDGTPESFEENWRAMNGGESKWELIDGVMQPVRGAGYIRTADEFGSCRLHVEFATPEDVKGDGQGRGNSGVFLMGEYEVQILDSHDNPTYPDGQCGAIYGRAVPRVNACRPPGEWQTYDITFHRPIFDDEGEVTRKARFTVIHNGVLIHDDVELGGGTGWMGPHAVIPYKKHGDTGPIALQDHGNPVRFRNIWVRKLDD